MITVEELKELGFDIAVDDEYMLVAYYDTIGAEIEVTYCRTPSKKDKWEERLYFYSLNVTGDGDYITKNDIKTLINSLK